MIKAYIIIGFVNLFITLLCMTVDKDHVVPILRDEFSGHSDGILLLTIAAWIAIYIFAWPVPTAMIIERLIRKKKLRLGASAPFLFVPDKPYALYRKLV